MSKQQPNINRCIIESQNQIWFHGSLVLALFFSRMAAKRDDVFPAEGAVSEELAAVPVLVSVDVLGAAAVAAMLLSSLTWKMVINTCIRR